ncbi:ATP-dependent DNA/RNA helicase [Sporothrix curviconia]|uniref:RNA helicase n=1 Tax=Sporothrix curviconia TaxID=1260050 RepID=A0ABP0CWI7_9PEZI
MTEKPDQNEAPEAIDQQQDVAMSDAVAAAAPAAETALAFSDFKLDPRILQATARQNYATPTLAQQRAIPLSMNGKDVLLKAKTGSGKTAAYLLPVMHAILKRKDTDRKSAFTAALILVPTRELADQVVKTFAQFSAFCSSDITALKLTDKVSDAVLRSFLDQCPDIVVSTPGRAWHAVSNDLLSLKDLTHLVLDEADLVLSYGYSEDLEQIASALPKTVQTSLISATMTTEVDTLKGMLTRNPDVLDLVEKEADGKGVTQYYVKCAEDEKFLLIYFVFIMKFITGKCLIFVSDVDRSYRLKLFFEQFGIRSCILNSEMPVSSRIHVIDEFNRNVYNTIIASDEHEVLGDEDQPAEDGGGDASAPKKKKRKAGKRDKEFGVSRGIDFKNVRTVINFDLPTSSRSYTHRIGRTARAGQNGMALSFVIPADQYRKHKATSVESTENDEKIISRIIKKQDKEGKEVKPFIFDMERVEAFRYRMNDALRAVSSVAVRKARAHEIRQELIKSEKLKRHFEENPDELHHLVRHDEELRTMPTQPHLKHVPDYMLSRDDTDALVSLRRAETTNERNKSRKDRQKFYHKKNQANKVSKSAKARVTRNRNPLQSFRVSTKK